jgi:hypothetical protein
MGAHQRLILGTLAAISGAVVGAILWAGITAALGGWQIGYMAIGVGLLAGYGMRLARDPSRAAAIVAAAVALAGCVLGNFLTMVAVGSRELHAPYLKLLGAMLGRPADTLRVMQAGFSPMDLVFYAIAAYAGFKAVRPRVVASGVTAGAQRDDQQHAQEQRHDERPDTA